MNKNMIIIITILIILLAVTYMWLNINTNQYRQNELKNYEYEQYKNEEIYGTEVITLINKIINQNESNHIVKDDKGFYIENDENSIIVDVVMIIDEDKKETKSYRMETINKVGIAGFIQNFNTAKFKLTKIEYHQKTGKIKKLIIEQQYE